MDARNFSLGLAASLVGLVVTVVLAEVMLRALGYRSSLVYIPNAHYGWSHSPGNRFTWESADSTVNVSINSAGLRDFEYGYQKPEGAKRILVLGDSFVEALQVPLEASVSKQIEQRLNPGAESGSSVQVISAGVSGFGTDNALLFYRAEGIKYQPDIVVLFFYLGNDVRNNWQPLDIKDSGEARKPYFEMSGDDLVLRSYPFAQHEHWLTKVRIFLNRNVVLYSFLREVRDRLRTREVAVGGKPQVPLDMPLFFAEYRAPWEQAWQLTGRILDELNREVAGNGAKLLLVAIPTLFQVQDKQWKDTLASNTALRQHQWDLRKPNQRLAGVAASRQIEHLDLLPVLRDSAARRGVDLYLESDGHWNAMGHEAAADVVAEALRPLL